MTGVQTCALPILETAVEEVVEAVEVAETVEEAEVVKEVETVEEVERVEATETVEEVETVEAAETVEATETVETVETAKTVEELETAVAESAEAMVVTEETADRESTKPENFPIYRKAYLIDSENISDEWVDILDTMETQDVIFVFYTGKSTHINCERAHKLMRNGIGRVQWIKCFEGNNALDFQLVTELGAMIGLGKAAEYIIVSKDNGYNPVVRYWNGRGIAVSKKATRADKKQEEPVEAITKAAVQKVSLERAEMPLPEKGEKVHFVDSAKAAFSVGFLGEVLKSVDIMDSTLLYAVLTAFEGQAAGAEDYRQLRDLSGEEKAALRGLRLQDKHERGVNYVRLIVRRNNRAADDVEKLYETILRSSKKNKDKYRKALVEKFGKESGENYYSMTKSHYNYVKKV